MPSSRPTRCRTCSTSRNPPSVARRLQSSALAVAAIAASAAALADAPPSDEVAIRSIVAETTPASAVVIVETVPEAAVVLETGVGDGVERRIQSAARRIHRFELTGLEPDKRYGYRAMVGPQAAPRRAFRTLGVAGSIVRLGVYGDVRGGHAVHRAIVERMLDEGLDAVAVTGDLVQRGSRAADWRKFFAITDELRAQLPYWPAIGNHDVGLARADVPIVALPPPAQIEQARYWYSRALGDLHLVFLDSNNYERGEQAAWLEADLAAARRRGVRAILAFTHDGPYSRGLHGGNVLARTTYAPLLARHRVDYLFAGHDHIYQRGEIDGLRYTVTGGGGAPLYPIKCGTADRPECKVEDGSALVAREHHYLVVTVGSQLEVCARRDDGRALEPCQRYPLPR